MSASSSRLLVLGCLVLAFGTAAFREAPAQSQGSTTDRFSQMSADAERKGLAEPFKGITADGQRRAGTIPDPLHRRLDRARAQGRRRVSRRADAGQRDRRPSFPVDDPEWRKWMNQHFYIRQGVSFKEMTEAQREAAIRLAARVAQRQGAAS